MVLRRVHPGFSASPAAVKGAVMALTWLLLAVQPLVGSAHETDQYTLPLGREFADLRFHFSRTAYDAIAEAAAFTNKKIANSLRDGQPTAETAQLQSAQFIAHEVWANLFASITTNEGLDAELNSAEMRARYPGLILAYKPDQYLYDDPLLVIDITKFVRTFFRGDTVNVGGTLFGTDKFLHFVHLGKIYHSTYLEARQEGLSEDAAAARAVEDSAGSNPFLSENVFLGTLSTGIRSNADLAADYAGLKFYRNLTEPVRIGATQLPPMLVRDGLLWRLDARVRPGSDFFAAFITPHFSEALNPNSFLGPVGERVRKMLRARCVDVVDWYRDGRGRVRSRAQFVALEQELSTFYGEPYGYQNDGEDTVSIATTCFEADGTPVPSVADRPALPPQADAPIGPGRDRFGRTALWWAAREGQRDAVERLVAAVENPNVRDIDGEAPLHAAARGGHAAVVALLIAHGADLGARDRYGVTPLLLAVEASQPDVARLLLAHGADANMRDGFGRSPLHQAALQGDRALAALLLEHGADPAARYGRSTPAQLAARAGYAALAAWLASVPTRSVAKHRRTAAGGG
jgi:ankyrin repeat protein